MVLSDSDMRIHNAEMKLAAFRAQYVELVKKHREDGVQLASIQHSLTMATAELESLRKDELSNSHK